VTLAAEAGQLQLNAFEPIIAFSLMAIHSPATNADQSVGNPLCGRNRSRRSGLRKASRVRDCFGHSFGAKFLAMNALPSLPRRSLQAEKPYESCLSRQMTSLPDLIDDMLNAEEMTRPSRSTEGKDVTASCGDRAIHV